MMSTPTLMSLQYITHQIDECLLNHTNEIFSKSREGIFQSLRCRRGVDRDMDAIQRFISGATSTATASASASASATATATVAPTASTCSHPLHFYILFESSSASDERAGAGGDDNDNDDDDYANTSKNNSESVVKGVAMWYFGYSTWQGKVMNVDTILTTKNEGTINEKIVLDVLVKIAKCFSLRRIVYQIQGGKEAELFKEKYGADLLGEWLTLAMRRDQMTSFLNTQSTWDPVFSRSEDIAKDATNSNSIIDVKRGSNVSKEKNIDLAMIKCVIDAVVSKINPSVKRRKSCCSDGDGPLSSLKLRRAEEKDSEPIFNLVRGLALYEKALDEVHVDERVYQLDGGGDNPMYHCIVLEVEGDSVTRGDADADVDDEAGTGAGAVVGMGFFYFGCSMIGGRFLYLEDLFIKKEYRGNGYGKAIMYALAEIARDLNCQNFVWQALDWNTPALNFYKSIGAEVCDGLITLRFDHERMQNYRIMEVVD